MHNRNLRKAFVLSTKEDQYIYTCVSKIRQFYIDDIIIVDSASTNKQYLLNIKETYSNIIIEDINNLNYEYGAILHSYLKYKNHYDIFIFLQDAMYIENDDISLDMLNEKNVLVFSSNNSGWSWDPEAHRLFKETCSDITKLAEFIDASKTIMCQFNAFAIKTKTLDKIVNSEIFKLAENQKPINKVGSRMWERLWSIVMASNGITIQPIKNLKHINKKSGNRM